jgi:uncharacterized membrane protein
MTWIAATTWLDRALGLQNLSLSQEGTSLGWRFALPLWTWVLIVLGVVLVAALAYQRLLGPKPARLALAVNRTLLLLLLSALLAGPVLVLSSENIEEDWLLLLVDRSASMTIEDMPPGDGGLTPVSRDAVLRRALAEQAAVFGDEGLGRGRRLHWLGFAGDTFTLDDPTLQLPDAVGQRTAIRTAIEQALQSATGRPISGVVLFTDGRSPQATGGDLVRRLQQHAVSVFPVPLGAVTAPLDLLIAQVDAPERAFVKDSVPVNVWLDAQGDVTGLDDATIVVRLIDETTGGTLDQKQLSGLPRDPVQLTARSDAAGPATWVVEIEHQPAPNAGITQRELITSNNRQSLAIELIDRPIRVLYVEGYPRWEYRYLVTMLKREESIQSSVMLLSADREFAQEGDLPITRLPNTGQEFEPYDVIIVGDVPPSYFSPEQITLMRDHVSSRGGGLLWIGGPRDMPRTYDGTPLADVLPMRRPAAVDRSSVSSQGLIAQPTPLAEALSVMLLTDPATPDAPPAWPTTLPPLQWVQSLDELKQAAEVLAMARPAGEITAQRDLPLIVLLRYGAGQSAYIATDDVWRWRYGRGELFHEQFWVQMVRMLARSRLQAATGRVRLTTSSRRISVDQPLVVELVIEDATVLSRELPRIGVVVRRSGVADAESDRLDLLPVAEPPSEAATLPGAVKRKTFRGTWLPREPGRFELGVSDPGLDDVAASVSLAAVEVLAPDDELRQTLPDHARLEALAAATGGQVVAIDNLAELQSLVPNRARKTPDDQREPLWNSYVALILVLFLLTTEWVGRKLIRLA